MHIQSFLHPISSRPPAAENKPVRSAQPRSNPADLTGFCPASAWRFPRCWRPAPDPAQL